MRKLKVGFSIILLCTVVTACSKTSISTSVNIQNEQRKQRSINAEKVIGKSEIIQSEE